MRSSRDSCKVNSFAIVGEFNELIIELLISNFVGTTGLEPMHCAIFFPNLLSVLYNHVAFTSVPLFFPVTVRLSVLSPIVGSMSSRMGAYGMHYINRCLKHELLEKRCGEVWSRTTLATKLTSVSGTLIAALLPKCGGNGRKIIINDKEFRLPSAVPPCPHG